MAKTMKELAKELNCSYEAVRKQVKRYGKELKEHIYTQHKTQYLDDYACDFIRGKRMDSPVTISRIEHDEAVELLKKKYMELLEKQTKLQEECAALRIEAAKVPLLEADSEAQKEKALALSRKAEDLQDDLKHSYEVRRALEDELEAQRQQNLVLKQEQSRIYGMGIWEFLRERKKNRRDTMVR